MDNRPSLLSSAIKIIRPGLILLAFLTYLLGMGIAHHLVFPINYAKASLGFILVIFLLEMREFLQAFYRHPSAPENLSMANTKVNDPYLDAVRQFKRPAFLYTGVVFIGAGALISTIMAVQGQLSLIDFLLLGLGLMICFFSAVPPLALSEKGYADIVESLLVATLVPALALSLQTENLHILLVMFSIPLTFFYLAMQIVRGLENYGKDSLLNRQTMLVRIGWQKGMNLHNLSLIGAYLLVGIFALLELPWSLTWPVLLSLPFAILQVLQIQSIAAGSKPNWRLLNLTAVATFSISAYMITLTLWIR